MIKRLSLLVILISVFFESKSQNIAQQLGYDKNAKLLIIHADDIGVSHSVNKASFNAFKSGSISSGSIMIPCSWSLEVAKFSELNPQYDLGLHLTITSEWENYKWDGISSSNEISSLLNSYNHFYDNTEDVKKYAIASEVKKEIQAQIDYAKKVGINPTHLDSHMGALSVRADIAKAYLEVGEENNIPVFLPSTIKPLLESINYNQENLVLVDKYYMMDGSGVEKSEWSNFYSNIINNLQPGFNVILVHLGYDNEELQAVTINHPDFGSSWRELDLQVLESKTFKNLLIKNNIKIIQWRDIKNIIYPNN